jgi:hypothetical protein
MFTLLPFAAAFASDFTVGVYDYTLVSTSNYTVKIDKCSSTDNVISIPSNVTYRNRDFTIVAIGDYAFENNTAREIIVPNSIKSIGNWSFKGAKAEKITLSETLEVIGEGAFAESGIVNMVIPDSYMPTLGTTLVKTFYNCKNLKTVTLGKRCAGELGPHLKTMDNTFIGCDNLEEIHVLSVQAPYWEAEKVWGKNQLNNPVFDNMTYTFATLYVPGKGIDNYKEAEPWKNFGTIKQGDDYVPSEYEVAINAIKHDNKSQWYEPTEYRSDRSDYFNGRRIDDEWFFTIGANKLSDGRIVIRGRVNIDLKPTNSGGTSGGEYDSNYAGFVDDVNDCTLYLPSGGTVTFKKEIVTKKVLFTKTQENKVTLIINDPGKMVKTLEHSYPIQ